MLTFSDWENYTDSEGHARTLDWSEAGMRGAPAYPYCEAIRQAIAMRYPHLSFPSLAHGSLDLRDVSPLLLTVRDYLVRWLFRPYADFPAIGWLDPDFDYSLGAMGEREDGDPDYDPMIMRPEDVLTDEEYSILQGLPMSKFGVRAASLRVMRKVFLKWRRWRSRVPATVNGTDPNGMSFGKRGETKETWGEAVASYQAALEIGPGYNTGESRGGLIAGRSSSGYGIQGYGMEVRLFSATLAGSFGGAGPTMPFAIRVLNGFDPPYGSPPIYDNQTFPYSGRAPIWRISHVEPAATAEEHDFYARFGHVSTFGDYAIPSQPPSIGAQVGFYECGRVILDYAFPL